MSSSVASRPHRSRLYARALGACLPLALLAGVTGTQSGISASPVTDVDTAEVASSYRWAANPENPTNPLAGRTWGVYKGNQEQSWQPYVNASGTTKEMLGEIALRPKSKWFGAWIKPADIDDKVRSHIKNAQNGDPNALVQITTFALKPWEHAACKSLPTEAQKVFYRRWTRSLAAGIGNAHVAIVLQADGPFALCAPGGALVYSRLIGYSAKILGSLPNTSVYIDAGAADWMKDDVNRTVKLLTRARVQFARGFALNSTHYSQTEREVRFGAAVARELENRGYADKHFIVNTSSNGKGFAGYTYKGSNFDHARVCESTLDDGCVTLGIPPTMDLTNDRWGLSDAAESDAAKYADAFMWFGRPWLYMQADPFDKERALQLVRTWPFRTAS